MGASSTAYTHAHTPTKHRVCNILLKTIYFSKKYAILKKNLGGVYYDF